jgi:hypothetical protein
MPEPDCPYRYGLPHISSVSDWFCNSAQNTFNETATSAENINQLRDTVHTLPDSLVTQLVLVQRDNYFKL